MICPSQAPKLMRVPICDGRGTGRLEGADWQKSFSTQPPVRSERSRSEIKMQQSWDEINWPKCRSKDDPSRYLIIFIIVDHCHFSSAQSWILFPCSFSCPEPTSDWGTYKPVIGWNLTIFEKFDSRALEPQTIPHICHFFSTYAIFGSIFSTRKCVNCDKTYCVTKKHKSRQNQYFN